MATDVHRPPVYDFAVGQSLLKFLQPLARDSGIVHTKFLELRHRGKLFQPGIADLSPPKTQFSQLPEFKFRTFFSSSFTRWCLGRLCVPGA